MQRIHSRLEGAERKERDHLAERIEVLDRLLDRSGLVTDLFDLNAFEDGTASGRLEQDVARGKRHDGLASLSLGEEKLCRVERKREHPAFKAARLLSLPTCDLE